MSSELERLLREARNTLPDPDVEATRKARDRALLALRRPHRRRRRGGALVAVALAVAITAWIGLGSIRSPAVEAADDPVGLGFLPEPGWYVLQSGGQASESRPAVSAAANVPFADGDDVRGLAESSGLPYETLLRLPPRGVVIVAVFLPEREAPPWLAGSWYRRMTLPLQVRAAVPLAESSAQVRPETPLGQYQIRAHVDEHDVDVTIYYGRERPTRAQRAAAQRQLAKLVVRPSRSASPLAVAASTGQARVVAPAIRRVDRTVQCATAQSGGVYEIENRVSSGVKQGSAWSVIPYAIVATGQVTSSQNALGDALVWVTAGKPSRDAQIGDQYYRAPVSETGTLGLDTRSCKPVKKKVPLTPKGLRGGIANQFGERFDCWTARRVLVRIRATLASAGTLRRRDGILRTTSPVASGQIAVRTTSGRPLIYATVASAGKATLFTARSCTRD